MACPLVAGVVALLKSQNPEATSQQIIDCLIQGCDNIDEQNPDLIGKIGAGRVNVYNSLICLQNITKYNPLKNDVFGIYPNPANDVIFIHLNGMGVRNLKIKDVSGKIICSYYFSEEVNRINIAELIKGFYILETEIDGKSLSTKLIKN
jgi:subtilisin family serine protease